MNDWYYEKNGQRLGAVTGEAIAQLLARQDINGDTLVWKQGMEAWTPLATTELVLHLRQTSTPPALPLGQVNNKFLWLLSFSPILCWLAETTQALFRYGDNAGMVAYAVQHNQYWYISLAILLSLGLADYKALEKAGVNLQKLNRFWVFVTPGYIWKRCQLFSQGYKFLWIWVASFIVSALLTART